MQSADTYTPVADEAEGEALIAASLGKPLSSDHPELVCQAGAIEHDHPVVGPSPAPPPNAPQIVRNNRMVAQAPPPPITPATLCVRLHYAAAPPVHPPQSAVVTSSGSHDGPRLVGEVTPETLAVHNDKPNPAKAAPATPPPPGSKPAPGSGVF